MKIHYQIEKEKESKEKIISEIKNNPKKNTFLLVIDKAAIIEGIYASLEKGREITIKIDEESEDYPNILKKIPPRFVLQENGIIDFTFYLKKFGFDLFKEKGEYFLKIKKKNEETIDLKLKLDTDKTVDLRLLSPDRNKNDKMFFGIRSYYYTKKN